MKNVLQKLKEVRSIIKDSDLKKAGRNEYSKFDYYTPEQVEQLVDNACSKTNTVVLCNLKADEFGLYQTLDFIDLESEEKLSFEMRTKHGSITATNETQQMGGTDTYSERYIKMKVFQIKDNNLDLDSQDNRPQQTAKPTYQPKANQQFKDDDGKDWITDEQFKNAIKTLMEAGTINTESTSQEVMKLLRTRYKVAKKYEPMVEEEIKNALFN
jgi:hypothetical protein